jgi:hypothetical protein
MPQKATTQLFRLFLFTLKHNYLPFRHISYYLSLVTARTEGLYVIPEFVQLNFTITIWNTPRTQTTLEKVRGIRVLKQADIGLN